MIYLLSFMLNMANLDPVIAKNCIEMNETNKTIKIEEHLAELKDMGFSCEKKKQSLSYACMNMEKKIIAKVVVMTDKKECLAFPQKTASDLKKLMNR